MGGVVASCMSYRDSSLRIENSAYTKAKATPGSVAVTEVGLDSTESPIYRSYPTREWSMKQRYEKYYNGNCLSQLKAVAEKFSDRKAMATRPIDRMEKAEIEENGKKKPWEFIHLKPTVYMTYTQMWAKMMAFGNGLRSVGLEPGAKVGIYEETRHEWLCGMFGLWSANLVGVTVYANLGEDALAHAVKESELAAIVLNGKSVGKFVKMCAMEGIKTPKLIVVDSIPEGTEIQDAEALPYEEVVSRGAALPAPDVSEIKPEDVAVIMYTSGTTGAPKGVVMTHGNVFACCNGMFDTVSDFVESIPPEEPLSYIAYLPLAHILEFAAENIILSRGGTLAYGNPRTLTDTSARPHGDLTEFRPHFLAGVPRVFDTIKKAVEAKLPPPGALARRVFDRAYEDRRDALFCGLDTPYWKEKAFAKPMAMLGGRCRTIISGGAPLSGATYEFLAVVFGCSVVQGYGLTETCSSCSAQRLYAMEKENIGALMESVEVKLRDVEQWKHTDPEPRGEILIRGPPVAQGYHMQAEKTKEAFLEDGWFVTGDVGQICKDGSMKIVGRVKALAKNVLGEYIAMEALEVTYVLNPLAIPNGVCVLVHPQKAYIAALMITDEKKGMEFAANNNITGEWPSILEKPEFQKSATISMAATAKAHGRKPFEFVKHVRVVADEWTPENGVLTAAMKLKRNVIDEKYASTIAELFKE